MNKASITNQEVTSIDRVFPKDAAILDKISIVLTGQFANWMKSDLQNSDPEFRVSPHKIVDIFYRDRLVDIAEQIYDQKTNEKKTKTIEQFISQVETIKNSELAKQLENQFYLKEVEVENRNELYKAWPETAPLIDKIAISLVGQYENEIRKHLNKKPNLHPKRRRYIKTPDAILKQYQEMTYENLLEQHQKGNSGITFNELLSEFSKKIHAAKNSAIAKDLEEQLLIREKEANFINQGSRDTIK